MESLTGIVSFVRTAETLSFVAAGRRLGISASAVGKNVAKLEASLGVRLLQRTTRRISLTEEGLLFLERGRRVLDELRDAELMFSGASKPPSGRVRVSLPTVGYRFLSPVLPAFRRLYPDIELDLEFNDRIVSLVAEGFDAVIRSGKQANSRLMSRRLGSFRFVLCASPAYFAARGIPLLPKDLAGHDGLRFRIPSTGKLQGWALARRGEADPVSIKTTLIANNVEAVLAAAIGGMGVAYLPEFLAREAIASGALLTVLDRFLVHSGQFSILWPSNRHLAPKVRVFVDFMADRLFKAA